MNTTANTNTTTAVGKLMIKKKADAPHQVSDATNNGRRRNRFITETLEFNLSNIGYEQLRNAIDEFVKPFLTEEQPEFVVKGIVPSATSFEQSPSSLKRNKRMVKKLKNESDFNDLMNLMATSNVVVDSPPPLTFAIKLLNHKKNKNEKIEFNGEQEQALNEKKQQIDQLKDEIKMKKDQIKVVKLEMKNIRISAKQQQAICHTNVATAATTTTSEISTIPKTEELQQANEISKEEKLTLKLQKKEEKKRFKLEKKMLKAQRKLEKIALKKKQGVVVITEPTTVPVIPAVEQQVTVATLTGTNSEPNATTPVIVTEPIVTEQPIMQTHEVDSTNTTTTTATTAVVNQEADLFKFQNKEEKRALKMEKKLEKQMIKAQRKLEKQAQKQERKERKLLLKQQASTTPSTQN